MLNCRNIEFSPTLALDRKGAAERVIDESIIRRIIAFALFILGANRAQIAKETALPPGTVRSLIRRVLNSGIEGFFDQRRNVATKAADTCEDPQPASIVHVAPETGTLIVGGGQVQLPRDNPIQRKVVLLSLIGEGMLSAEGVAAALDLSVSHVRRLHSDLMASDVEAVFDKRRGQLCDYRFGPELKGRMILQFVLELAESGRASGSAVARRLGQECDERVSERTVRHHLNRMGLTSIKEQLTTGLRDLKRGSGNS